MALLQVIRGLNPGQQFPLESTRNILGRHPECDIVLDVGAVSRQHAVIMQEGNDYFVEDLNSRNGTFVNDVQIEGRHLLHNNDQVKICDLLFTFHSDSSSTDGPGLNLDTATAMALMVDDPEGRPSSTVMSTVNVQSSREGFKISVNPELKLKALLEITRNLGAALKLDAVLQRVLDSLFKIFIQADRGFVALYASPGGPLIPKAAKHRKQDQGDTIRISRTIVAQVTSTKEAILSADAASDSRFDTSQSIADFRIRSMMCAPLVSSDGEVLGLIQIDTLDQRSRFQNDDLEVLAAVACQAAVAVENAQLHESAMQQRALQRDLELAHRVQRGFLPGKPPPVAGFEFFSFYEAANQVGGDYFDYVSLPGNRLGVVLADVSGKGVSAALIMAKLSSEVRFSLASLNSAAEAMTRLNAEFVRSGWEDRFVTCVMLMLDLATGEVSISNAGHMEPRIRHANGAVEAVGEAIVGLPIGVTDNSEYEQFSMTLAPGDTLVVFTDGFSEAMNASNDLYGLERLDAQLATSAAGPQQAGETLLADVRKFAGARAQSDDMCLICLGRV